MQLVIKVNPHLNPPTWYVDTDFIIKSCSKQDQILKEKFELIASNHLGCLHTDGIN
jgi:hypothetical protein